MSDSKRRDSKGRILLNGETQESNGRYKYRYIDLLGNRKTVYSWRLTKADPMPANKRADKPLRELEKEIQIKLYQGIVDTDMTVLELVDKYLSTKTGVKHNTKANYNFVRNIIKEETFGTTKIDRIKLSDAKIFLIKLQENGRGYSSIHSIRGVLRPAFQIAVDDGVLVKNPFEFQLATVVVNDSVTREAITRDQERKYLSFIQNDNHYKMYYDVFFVLFKTGLRISELCGLTINDIDFENNVIKIDHQLQRMRDMTYVIEPTKTTAGTRQIPMTDEVREAFIRIVDSRKKPRIEPMVDGYAGFLFLDKNNMPKVAGHFEHAMKRSVEKYNKIYKVQMPNITPHVCRHTYCSNMAKSGMNPKTLQYLMGHSDISVTMNTYTHIGFEDAKDELERMKVINVGTKKSKIRGIV